MSEPAAATVVDDGYDALAEFHDLFMGAPWERLRPALESSFGALDETDVVVDVGAGSGVGTRVLAASTRARVVAVEPSRSMRAMLLARVADDPHLVGRVSVVAGAAPQALSAVDGPVNGFVCAHVLGHQPAPERAATFGALRRLVLPGAVGLVTVDVDGSGGEVVQEERRIGKQRYVARHLPAPPGRWVSEYEVLSSSGDVVRGVRCTGRWEAVTTAVLTQELNGSGWSVAPLRPGLVQLRLDDGGRL